MYVITIGCFDEGGTEQWSRVVRSSRLLDPATAAQILHDGELATVRVVGDTATEAQHRTDYERGRRDAACRCIEIAGHLIPCLDAEPRQRTADEIVLAIGQELLGYA
jgi:hypothetical protein